MSIPKIIVALCLLFFNLINSAKAEETMTQEDSEIIKNLSMLEDMDILESSDMSLLDNYDDVDKLDTNGGENNEYQAAQ